MRHFFIFCGMRQKNAKCLNSIVFIDISMIEKAKIKRICKNCNKIFFVFEKRHQFKNFCCKKCKNKYHNTHFKGENKYCPYCNKEININSNMCRMCAYKKRDLKASKNGRWKGGTSQGYQLKIYTSILKDNGVNIDKCDICGITRENTKKMCVHHKDGNHSNNKFTNLINLCNKCHMEIHYKKRIKLNCKNCHKEFETVPSKKNRKYCSLKCKYDSRKD